MSCGSRRGGALIAVLMIVVTLAGVVAAVFSLCLAQNAEVNSTASDLRALYTAETGISDSLIEIATSVEAGTTVPAQLGTYSAPIETPRGRYWSTLVDNGDTTFTVTSHGMAGGSHRALEVVIEQSESSIYDHAIFAGNSSGDPGYTLDLEGIGVQADSVTGDIYSAGDIVVQEDATLTGDAYASGTITGIVGTEGVSRTIPNITGMDYENNNDFDVASMFAAATWQSSTLGGSAYQMPEASPAHIFRKNPDDRNDETSSTVKDDFFLEDPYMPDRDWTIAATGQEGHTITLSGTMGYPGPNGNEKVYFIDGNLWVNAGPFGRLRFINTDAGEGARVTLVVKGNIYFGDDVYLADHATDGVAFIAIEDASEPDSGNVYLGDPRYGTVETVEGYLYAENNFYDLNLDETGSKEVSIFGNMTAGNQVDIQRTYVDPTDGSTTHSKLSVTFDDRVSSGLIQLPGLPTASSDATGHQIVFWREVSKD